MTLHVVRFSNSQAPLLTCRFCDAVFYEHEHRKRVAHVEKCYREAEESGMLDALRLTSKPFFDPAKLGTKDIEDWMAEQDASGESNSDKVKRGSKKLS